MNAIVLMFAAGDPRQYPSIPPSATPPSCPCQVVNHLSANEYNAGQLLTLGQSGLGYLSIQIQAPNIQVVNVEEILALAPVLRKNLHVRAQIRVFKT